ncbi:MAG: SspB family protein [Acetobacteraceae bacterium]
MEDDETPPAESLLPYDSWTEEALRLVVVRALAHVASEGLPGDHHFYITFRTDHPGVTMPGRLRIQYPQEMTIVLQHQFRDLVVDEGSGGFTVGLSFGGVPATLSVPFAAVTAFADPAIRFGLRFTVPESEAPGSPAPAAEPAGPPAADALPEAPQVVSLEAFRRRTPPKP